MFVFRAQLESDENLWTNLDKPHHNKVNVFLFPFLV